MLKAPLSHQPWGDLSRRSWLWARGVKRRQGLNLSLDLALARKASVILPQYGAGALTEAIAGIRNRVSRYPYCPKPSLFRSTIDRELALSRDRILTVTAHWRNVATEVRGHLQRLKVQEASPLTLTVNKPRRLIVWAPPCYWRMLDKLVVRPPDHWYLVVSQNLMVSMEEREVYEVHYIDTTDPRPQWQFFPERVLYIAITTNRKVHALGSTIKAAIRRLDDNVAKTVDDLIKPDDAG